MRTDSINTGGPTGEVDTASDSLREYPPSETGFPVLRPGNVSLEMATEDERRRILADAGARDAEIDELLDYNRNPFDHTLLPPLSELPLADEPFVQAWRGYAEAAAAQGLFRVLCENLVQLRFPIQHGLSESQTYRLVTRQGGLPENMDETSGLRLVAPDELQLDIYPTPAGCIPILTVKNRDDFVALLQALLHRNEPVVVPDSKGACMVAGYNNWGRIRSLQQAWEQERTAGETVATWDAEFQRIIPRKELYQDRFILLSSGPYSGVPASDLGLDTAAWLESSWILRREHEATHYFTRRMFRSMRNNLLDEIMADYMGITAAEGRFRADWFLRFMGLEQAGCPRPSGRLAVYRSPLSDRSFRLLAELVRRAAENLAAFDRCCVPRPLTSASRTAVLVALAHGTLEAFAAEDGVNRLEQVFRSILASNQMV